MHSSMHEHECKFEELLVHSKPYHKALLTLTWRFWKIFMVCAFWLMSFDNHANSTIHVY